MRDSGDFEQTKDFRCRLIQAARNLALFGLVCSTIIAMLRFSDIGQPLLFGLVPIAPAVALVCLVAWGLLRGPLQMGGCLLVAIVLATLMLPGEILPRRGCDIAAATVEESIVVMSHNLLIVNREPDAVRAQVQRVDPDVLAFQEVSDEFTNGLLVALADDYPYIMVERNQALLSRWPLAETRVVDAESTYRKPMLIATVESPIGGVRIANFHADPPFETPLREVQEQQFAFLAEDPDVQDIDVLIGDFNAPSSDRKFREMRSTRFTDAHRVAGCGLGTTWSPRGTGPSLLSIDHALLADTVTAESFEIFDYAGSDHRAIAVRVTARSRP